MPRFVLRLQVAKSFAKLIQNTKNKLKSRPAHPLPLWVFLLCSLRARTVRTSEVQPSTSQLTHQLGVSMGYPQVIRYLIIPPKSLLTTSLRADEGPLSPVNKPHMALHVFLGPEVILATNLRAGEGSLPPVNNPHMALHLKLDPEVLLTTNLRAGKGSFLPLDKRHMVVHV